MGPRGLSYLFPIVTLPRDLIATATVKELAGAVYGGIALGVGFWSLDTSLARSFGPGFRRRLLGPYE